LETDFIIQSFLTIKSINDLVVFLNNLNGISHLSTALIDLERLFLCVQNPEQEYKTFLIPKKNGKTRIIHAPNQFLKSIQQKLNYAINLIFIPTASSHGFIKKRNIITNACVHVNKRYIYNLDLEDFFSSIKFGRVKKVLTLLPFNFDDNIAELIAKLCCYAGALPQGAPSSPILTNIICKKLDNRLTYFCEKRNITYTRYADDLTFSSNEKVFSLGLKHKIKNIISIQNFIVNNDKERFQTKSTCQIVTGIVVNEKLNVSRKFIKRLRAILHCWEYNGYEATIKKYQSFYEQEWHKDINFNTPQFFYNVIMGQIQFLGFVRGKSDAIYQKYLMQFRKLLSASKEVPKNNNDSIENLLDILENEGFDAFLNFIQTEI
jgi:RNA-directed DNA polymerase